MNYPDHLKDKRKHERLEPLMNPNIEILKECQKLMAELVYANNMIIKMVAEPKLVIQQKSVDLDD